MSVGICVAGLPSSPAFPCVTDMSVSVTGTRADQIARFSLGGHLVGDNTFSHFRDGIALFNSGTNSAKCHFTYFYPHVNIRMDRHKLRCKLRC